MRNKILICALIYVAVFTPLAWAKRGAAPVVDPVLYENIKYTAPNDDGFREYIEAWDMNANSKLWELTIFINPKDGREKDVQWKFIERLERNNDSLLITDESGRQFVVDLGTKQIERLK